MKFFVIDASVIVKWIFPEDIEEHVPQALQLLQAIQQGSIKIIQPPHWLAEVASVIVRVRPEIAKKALEFLQTMELVVESNLEIFHIASSLAEQFAHHLFDTLYHAVALYHKNRILVTADQKYYRKSSKEGSIIQLNDLPYYL